MSSCPASHIIKWTPGGKKMKADFLGIIFRIG
jgi:hypothetical protein